MRLEEICAPVAKELQTAESKVKSYLNSDNKFVRRLNAYITNKPGKMLRPALVLLSAKTGTDNPRKAVSVAAAVEIIHTATLIHDDVVDDSETRRGQPTISSKWGNDISIILGDRWYSRAIAILFNSGIPEILEMLLETVNGICTGELEHLKRSYDLSLGEEEYLEIIRKKTAGLMSFCCKAGALTGKVSVKNSRALAEYGLNLGIAFQIVDDCLDIAGPEEKTGKPSWNDILRGKVTLPVIYAINATGQTDKRWVKKVFESRQIDKNDAKRIANIAKQCDTIRLCLEKAAEYRDISREALGALKDCKSRHALSQLADHIVEKGFGLCLS